MKTSISTIHTAIAVAAVSIFLPVGSAADNRRRAESNAAIVRRNLFSPVISAASGVVGFSHDHRRRKVQEETSGTAVPTFSLSNLDDELVDLLEDIGLGIDDLTDIEFDDLTGLDDNTLMGVGGDDAFLDEMLGAIFSPEVMACAADMEGIMTDELAAAEKAIEDYTEEASNTAMENMDPSSSDYSTQIIIPDDLIQAHQRACEDAGGIFTLYSKFDCGGDDFLGLGMSVQVDTVGMTGCVADTQNCASVDVTALAGSIYETMGMTCTSEISPSGAMPVEIIGDDGVGDAPTTDDPEAEDAVVTKEGDAAAVTSTGFLLSSSAAMVLAATTFVGSIVL